MRRPTTGVLLAALAASAAAPAPPAGAEPPVAQVGVVVDTSSPDAADVAAAFRDALRGAAPDGREIRLIERTTGGAEAETWDALAHLPSEGAEVVVAIGEAAARVAPEAVRYCSVVVVSATVAPAVGDRVRVVSTTADSARFAEEAIRTAPASLRIAVVGPGGGAADAVVAALRPAAPLGATVERVRPSGATGGYALASVAGADLVVASPDTSAADVTDLARALAGRGTSIVGSRPDHLGAGAAVVLHPSPADVGCLAATALIDSLRGAAGAGGVRRPRRLVREVHLGNARRLGWTVPLTVLAASDRTVSPPRERR